MVSTFVAVGLLILAHIPLVVPVGAALRRRCSCCLQRTWPSARSWRTLLVCFEHSERCVLPFTRFPSILLTPYLPLPRKFFERIRVNTTCRGCMRQLGGELQMYVLEFIADVSLRITWHSPVSRISCGHVYHPACIQAFAAYCAANGLRPLCPACLEEFDMAVNLRNIHFQQICALIEGYMADHSN